MTTTTHKHTHTPSALCSCRFETDLRDALDTHAHAAHSQPVICLIRSALCHRTNHTIWMLCVSPFTLCADTCERCGRRDEHAGAHTLKQSAAAARTHQIDAKYRLRFAGADFVALAQPAIWHGIMADYRRCAQTASGGGGQCLQSPQLVCAALPAGTHSISYAGVHFLLSESGLSIN